ncbi:hypothetical protein MAR_033899 [Mya arenaria]|uniref:Reverse transcriptase domain-containing protein n=1 Tax=Mya arenaria TaxID=6604 RepID=A0ABY7GAA5_MYAAR|nr:hypothetical protein MAR_033899 [Mya arenaria]
MTEKNLEYNVIISDCSVKRRLKNSSIFGKMPFAQTMIFTFMMAILDHGYVIPFETEAPSFQIQNNKSALTNSDFVLIDKRCAKEVQFEPYNCSTYTYVKKIRLSSKIIKKHLVLPFGLSSAPRLFTKGLRPLVKYLRNAGLKISTGSNYVLFVLPYYECDLCITTIHVLFADLYETKIWSAVCQKSCVFAPELFSGVLDDSKCSKSKLNNILYAIKWSHTIANVKSPCDNDWQKLCSISILTHILKLFLQRYTSADSFLADLRISWLFLLIFAGFLRFSEMLVLKRSFILIFDTHCDIFVTKSKSDVIKYGKHVVIASTGISTRQVGIL